MSSLRISSVLLVALLAGCATTPSPGTVQSVKKCPEGTVLWCDSRTPSRPSVSDCECVDKGRAQDALRRMGL